MPIPVWADKEKMVKKWPIYRWTAKKSRQTDIRDFLNTHLRPILMSRDLKTLSRNTEEYVA